MRARSRYKMRMMTTLKRATLIKGDRKRRKSKRVRIHHLVMKRVRLKKMAVIKTLLRMKIFPLDVRLNVLIDIVDKDIYVNRTWFSDYF